MAEINSVVADRKVAALRQAMGPVIGAALADRHVVEVMVNPDGKIWVDRIGEGRSFTGERLAPEDANRILRLLADHVGEVVTKGRPRISATRPLTGERGQGGFMPRVHRQPLEAARKALPLLWHRDYLAAPVARCAASSAGAQLPDDGPASPLKNSSRRSPSGCHGKGVLGSLPG